MQAGNTAAAGVAVARPSSTVVLLRGDGAAPEVLMVRRHAASAFGAAYAFPGGVVEADDRGVHAHCAGLSAEDADALLGTEHGLDYFSSAIRELFEETGVLLAQHDRVTSPLEPLRDRLNDGSLAWHDFVAQNQIMLSCDALDYFGYWVTPDVIPRRYSTRFFVAELPQGQQAKHCGDELTDSVWMTASDVLAASEAGDMLLHFPTLKTLADIARHDSIASVRDWCRVLQRQGIPRIQPTMVGGKPVIR
ncbi:MAG: NUDIX hydrolase [Woeseiaceae bacterium]|nr:NUDIX hydrolase [Woeseiaceae bacterium]